MPLVLFVGAMIALCTFSWITGANGGDSLVLSADTSGLEADTLMQNCTQEKMTKKKSIQMLEISICLWFDRLSSGHFCHLVSALERHISRYWRWQELQQPLQVAKFFLFIYLFYLKAEASLEILDFSHFDYFQSTQSLSNIEICLKLLIKLVK